MFSRPKNLKDRQTIWVKFYLVFAALAIAAFAVYYAWSASTLEDQAEREVLAEARTLSAEMDAVWLYIDQKQDVINYNHGVYDFKGVYCASAGMAIAKEFNATTDYTIRYVRESPRLQLHLPDEFELEALEAFAADDGLTEYYATAEYYPSSGTYSTSRSDASQTGSSQEGEAVFRYVRILRCENNCLECHGEPAGEKDVVGFVKEGMQLGDIAGAVSIVMPMAEKNLHASQTLFRSLVLFITLFSLVTILLFWSLRRTVTGPITNENERLIAESEIQSNFLATMTHELKTPLTSIIAFAHLWQDRKPGDNLNEGELVKEIENNSNMLLAMINNVLDTAKIEAGQLRLNVDEMDMNDVVYQVKSVIGPLALQEGIDLVIEVDDEVPILCGDAEAIRRMVVNLMSNALRFTSEGGWIKLSVRYDGGWLRIVVSDCGKGIEPAELDAVFDKFVSTKGSSKSAEGGTGLGLFIVKNFAEMMQGKVWAKSELGKGSVFGVDLPLQPLEDDDDEDE